MLRLVLSVLALGAAAVMLLAAFRRDRFRVARSATMQAPPERTFPFIDDLREQAKWLPYYRKDPAIRLTCGSSST